MNQGSPELHALLVPVRELLHPRVRPVLEADVGKPSASGLRRRGGREPRELGEVDELLEDPHLRVQTALFRHVAEAVQLGGAHRIPLPPDLSAVGDDKAEDRSHRGGLPGAVRPEEPNDPALRDREARPFEGHDVSVVLRQIRYLEQLQLLRGILPEDPDKVVDSRLA